MITTTLTAGHPIVSGTKLTGAGGHYIVIVGYNESGGGKQIIAYDPFGRWTGGTSYDYNSTVSTAVKGRWVYYDFTNTTVFDPADRYFVEITSP